MRTMRLHWWQGICHAESSPNSTESLEAQTGTSHPPSTPRPLTWAGRICPCASAGQLFRSFETYQEELKLLIALATDDSAKTVLTTCLEASQRLKGSESEERMKRKMKTRFESIVSIPIAKKTSLLCPVPGPAYRQKIVPQGINTYIQLS